MNLKASNDSAYVPHIELQKHNNAFHHRNNAVASIHSILLGLYGRIEKSEGRADDLHVWADIQWNSHEEDMESFDNANAHQRAEIIELTI